MKCVLPGPNVKTLTKALHTLSKIGEELYVEFLADELAIRAVSSSKSAYGAFLFRQDFFIDFRNEFARDKDRRRSDTRTRFRFNMKAILPIFKSSNVADKQLESCEIEADIKDCRMHFTFVKKSRVVHRHSVCLMETDVLQTAYTKRYTKSSVTASAKLLTETIIEPFPNTIDEITLTFQKERFMVSNYTADLPDPKTAAQTQLMMDIDEFDFYQIEEETALTCTLKELKGIVSFTSTFTYNSDITGITGLPIKMHFTGPGVPLLLYIESPNQYEASFVVATLEASPRNTQNGSQRGSVLGSQPNIPPKVPASDPGVTSENGNQSAPRLFAHALEPEDENVEVSEHEQPSNDRAASPNSTQRSNALSRKVFGLGDAPKRTPQQVAHRVMASDSESEADSDKEI